jgi:hypothetical protein
MVLTTDVDFSNIRPERRFWRLGLEAGASLPED